MNRFCFIDSSGILAQDRFFGVGLLVIKNVGDMIDKLAKNWQPAYSTSKNNKKLHLQKLITAGKKDEVIKILENSGHFEMKFDNLRKSTEPFYKKMFDIFLSDQENRFSAMLIDKNNPSFNNGNTHDAWENYTDYTANLIAKEMLNLSDDNMCIIVDEITKPSNKPLSLENTILSKLRDESIANPQIKFDNVFGVLSIESHSNMLMQLTDVLLGSVMYDFKKQNKMTSTLTENRKDDLVDKIRQTFAVDTLAQNFEHTTQAYFKVFEG